MPSHPVRPGFKACTFEFRSSLVDHLDQQAAYEGCSRAAYVRRLIVRDMERQGPTRRITPSAAQQG